MIVDARAGMVPLEFEGGALQASLLIHKSPLLDALIDLFELVWAAASPLPLAAAETDEERRAEEAGLQPELRAVLELLVGGLKDEAMGRALGLSKRTIDRRVNQLMQLVGARTRFQVGYFAAQQGLLADVERR